MKRSTALASVVLAATTLLAGCHSSPASGSRPTPAPVNSRLQGELSTSSPKASIDPNFDFGQFVIITNSAFEPKQLLCAVNKRVTWLNHSSKAVTLHFDNYGGLVSPAIPPGGSWSITPSTTVSITYHDESNPTQRAAVQVMPTVEP